MRQLRGKRDHVIMLLRRAAHGLTEAERHEVRFQLLKHTLGAALCRHKDHARTVKQGRQGKIQTGELTARHRMASDVVHTGVERRLLQTIDHKLLDADHIHDHAALFHLRHVLEQPVYRCLRVQTDDNKVSLLVQRFGRNRVNRAVSQCLLCSCTRAVPAQNAAERARLDGFRHRAAHQAQTGDEYGIKHEWVPPVFCFLFS